MVTGPMGEVRTESAAVRVPPRPPRPDPTRPAAPVPPPRAPVTVAPCRRRVPVARPVDVLPAAPPGSRPAWEPAPDVEAPLGVPDGERDPPVAPASGRLPVPGRAAAPSEAGARVAAGVAPVGRTDSRVLDAAAPTAPVPERAPARAPREDEVDVPPRAVEDPPALVEEAVPAPDPDRGGDVEAPFDDGAGVEAEGEAGRDAGAAEDADGEPGRDPEAAGDADDAWLEEGASEDADDEPGREAEAAGTADDEPGREAEAAGTADDAWLGERASEDAEGEPGRDPEAAGDADAWLEEGASEDADGEPGREAEAAGTADDAWRDAGALEEAEGEARREADSTPPAGVAVDLPAEPGPIARPSPAISTTPTSAIHSGPARRGAARREARRSEAKAAASSTTRPRRPVGASASERRDSS
jgi:hypothetical protein